MIISNILIFMLVTLTGCGRDSFIDPEIRPYVIAFEDNIQVPVLNTDVIFGELPGNIVGRCTNHYNFSNDQIVIDRRFWKTSGVNLKEQLVFHELGHCVLGRPHFDELDAMGCPLSIMHSHVFGGSFCYSDKRGTYYQEMREHTQ